MIQLREFSVHYGSQVAVDRVSLTVAPHTIHAIIGPAGAGKTTLLRAVDLLASQRDGAVLSGAAEVGHEDIVRLSRARWPDPARLAAHRRRVGMVFAVPHPLPGSIYENVAFGARRAGVRGEALDARVAAALKDAQLWDEVHDRLALAAGRLSGGQQQRLCLARVLALHPEVLLLDEPCSGLDPISTAQIERTLESLSSRVTCVLVTNSLAQARRVSRTTSFMLGGTIVETAATDTFFTSPADDRSAGYVSGRFG